MKAIVKSIAAVLTVAAVSSPALAADKEYRFVGELTFRKFEKH